MWNSGEINNQGTSAIYSGLPLYYDSTYYLRIKLNNGGSWGEWQYSWFITYQPKTLYVPAEFNNIQDALNASINGDTILVADGTYAGDGNRGLDFLGKSILLTSVNGSQYTIIDCEGSYGDYQNGVRFHLQEDSNAVIDGFTIIKASSRAINIIDSSPKILNCLFAQCGVMGALYCDKGSPIIRNCEFRNNTSGCSACKSDDDKGKFNQPGGGIELHNNSDAIILNCLFQGNVADGTSGGAIAVFNSSPVIKECNFYNNWAGYYSRGGGIFYSNSNGQIENCVFKSNIADNSGGGIFLSSEATPSILNCRFVDNVAAWNGGAISGSNANVIIDSCIFAYNKANVYDCCSGGGAIQGGGTIINSIFIGNTVDSTDYNYHGTALYGVDSLTMIANSLFAFNGSGNPIYCFDNVGKPNLICCNIYGNIGGDWVGCIADQNGLNGNISLDPMFCDTANDVFTIKDISPCAPENNECATLIGSLGVGCLDERPEISSLAELTVFEDSTLNYTAEFTDPDGPDTVVTFINMPSWLTVAGWGISGVPTEGVVDSSFTLIVSDGYKADTQVVAIDVITVNDAPVLAEIEDQVYYEGSHYELPVSAFDIDGPAIELTTSELPPNATFYDSSNGAGLFTFDPDIDQAGVVSVFFIASDGEYADSQRVKFTVLESDIQIASLKIDNLVNPQHLTNHTPIITWSYTDPLDLKAQTKCEVGVGTDDDWTYAELWNPAPFNTSDTFVTYGGAPLIDGASYYLRLRLFNGSVWSHWLGAIFRMNSVPSVPILSALYANAVLAEYQPIVFVINSADPEEDQLTYDYEVFSDSAFGDVELHLGFNVGEQSDSTGWLVDAILHENWKYWWRARSYDGFEYSDWTAIESFWINVNEESPETFSLISPDISLGIAYNMLPDLTWTTSSDSDPLDSVYYRITIANDSNFVFKYDIDSIWNETHTLTDSLNFGTQYWWKVTAIDNTGLYTNSNNVMTFKTWKLGDASGDWQVNLLDILFLIDDLYGTGSSPNPAYAGDVNGDCAINLIDILYLIAYIYNFPPGPAPVVGCE